MDTISDLNRGFPTSDQIEQDQARILMEERCAILIIEHLPVGSEFGIDMTAYRVGERFKGVKMIPPGVHFVYASATDKNGQCGPRSGFFHDFVAKEVLVKRWSASEEDFDDFYSPTAEHIECYQTNIRQLDPHLGPYSFSNYNSYLRLTSKMGSDIVKKLMPDCNRIRSVPYLTSDSSNSASDQPQKRLRSSNLVDPTPTEETLLPNLKPDNKTVIHFTKIPSTHMDSKQKISHEMITRYHLDTSMKLANCYNQSDRERLLAEFQFAFVTFILCHVYESFEHWKKLLELICLADSDLNEQPHFYAEFVEVLRHQLDHIPEDLFLDIVDSNNLVRHMLDIFFQNLEHCSAAPSDLLSSSSELRTHLEGKFGWQFELEPEDEQPVIVDL